MSTSLPFTLLEDKQLQQADGVNLTADKQQQIVFQWLSTLLIELQHTTQSVLKAHQPAIEKQLKSATVLKSSSAKQIRNLIGLCYTVLFKVGETKTLFETVQGWTTTLTSYIKGTSDPQLMTLVHVMGLLMETHGLKVLSMGQDIIALLLKLLSKHEKDLSLKVLLINSLALSLFGLGKALNDPMHKEIYKIMKLNLMDKILSVRNAAAVCLQSLLLNSLVPVPVQEIEALVATCIKAFEESNYSLRKSLSTLVGISIASTQGLAHVGVQIIDKKKKAVETKEERVAIKNMLSILYSALVKNFSSSESSRLGIIESYAALFQVLGNSFIQEDLQYITQHIVDLSLDSKIIDSVSSESMLSEIVGYLFKQVHERNSTESGQIHSVQVFADILKAYCSKADDVSQAIVCILIELSKLFAKLGYSVSAAQESIIEPLINSLFHHSYAVQIHSASALKSLVQAQPSLLSRMIQRLLSIVEKDFANLSFDNDSACKKYQGATFGLTAILNAVKEKPLYVSFDILTKIYSWSSEVIALKEYSNPIVSFKRQMAWTILIPLMGLGQSYVKLHLTQFLLLLSAEFPRYAQDDPVFQMSQVPFFLFLNTKLSALGVLLNFLQSHSAELMTSELAKRIVKALENALSLHEWTREYDHSVLYVKRLFQCFSLIKPSKLYETSHEMLLNLSNNCLLQEVNCATSKLMQMMNPDDIAVSGCIRDVEEKDIEKQIMETDFGSFEYDSFYVFSTSDLHQVPQSPDISCIDEAAALIGSIMTNYDDSVQEEILTLWTRVYKPEKNKDLAVKYSQEKNVLVAFNYFLKNLLIQKLSINSPKVLELSQELLSTNLVHNVSLMRCVASEALGRLVQLTNGGAFANQLISTLVEQVINNKDPEARASYGMALGCIYRQVGGMAGGSHLKVIIGMLQSLSVDPNPIVHTWAIHALSLAMESAGLMLSSYVSTTLVLVTKLLFSPAHDTIIHSSKSNPFNSSEFTQILAKVLSILLGIMGPELQSNKSTSQLSYQIMECFLRNSEPFVRTEGLKCLQQFILLNPKQLDITKLVPYLQSSLFNGNKHIRRSSVTCLRQFVQRDPALVQSSSQCLPEQLLCLLDIDNDLALQDEVKDILTSMVNFNAATLPSPWIAICKDWLSKNSTAGGNSAPVTGESAEEEGSPDKAKIVKTQEISPDKLLLLHQISSTPTHWRTQVFAVQLLRKVVQLCTDKEHTDFALAKRKLKEPASRSKTSDYLIFKIQELIKLAFNASTSLIDLLRLEGLLFMQDLLTKFSTTQDPEFEGHSILEQYQAQISTALTPVFSSDVVPEIQAAGVRVCAIYVGSGISQEIATLQRVVKLLTGCLENLKSDKDMSEFSAQASTMIRLAVLVAWAELLVASSKQKYLDQVLKPHLTDLGKLWAESLKDYAQIKVDSEWLINNKQEKETEVNSSSFQALYAASALQVLVPYYQKSWLVLLSGIGELVAREDKDFLHLLTYSLISSPKGPNKTFFVILGLCLETVTKEYGIPFESFSVCIETVGKIISPTILKSVFLDKLVFLEILSIFDRLFQVEDVQRQHLLLQVLSKITHSFSSTYLTAEFEKEKAIADHGTILFHIYKIVVHVFSTYIPKLAAEVKYTSPIKRKELQPQQFVPLFGAALDILVDTWNACLSNVQLQLLPFCLKLCSELLLNEKFVDVGSKVVLVLKSVFENLQGGIATQKVIKEIMLPVLEYDMSNEHVTRNISLSFVLMNTGCPKCFTVTELKSAFAKWLIKLLESSSIPLQQTGFQSSRALFAIAAKSDQSSQDLSQFFISEMIPSIFLCLHKNGTSEIILSEGIKTIQVLLSVLPKERAESLVTLIVPLYITLLGSFIPANLSQIIKTHLLQVAASYSNTLKWLVTQLPDDKKTILEQSFRQNVEPAVQKPKAATPAPANFSNFANFS